MYKISIKIFIIIVSLQNSIASATEPYCMQNETIITRIPVTKTRHVIRQPKGVFKFFKKPKVFVEEYQDFEDHLELKLVRKCCKGYMKSKFDMCEPICESGCPKKSNCVEPNRCRCQRGFISAVSVKDGSHYCEPICNGGCPVNARCAEPDVCECEKGYLAVDYGCKPHCSSGCPYGGLCVRPDQCQCANGYKAEFGSCIPVCTTGNGCQNGRCVDVEECRCNEGHAKHLESNICEKICVDDMCDDDNEDSRNELTTTASLSFKTPEQEPPLTSENENTAELDESEKIFLTPPSDEVGYSEEIDTTIGYSKCPPKYIFYEYECRPQVFASNEVDCRMKPCVENAFCQVNGICACNPGYDWFNPMNNADVKTKGKDNGVCLTLTEISNRFQKAGITEGNEDIDWLNLSFIMMGVLCMMAALCFMVVKIVHKRNGKMDVEANNDLYCTYDSKNSKEVPLVL